MADGQDHGGGAECDAAGDARKKAQKRENVVDGARIAHVHGIKNGDITHPKCREAQAVDLADEVASRREVPERRAASVGDATYLAVRRPVIVERELDPERQPVGHPDQVDCGDL
jgi:hypothetical protein